MNFLLEWKVIAASQLYWPAFFASEYLLRDIVGAVVIGILLVFAAWAAIWLVEFGPVGRNQWVQDHLHLHPHIEL